MSEADVVSRLRSGMTIGIGGWGSRRKPMSLVREILKSELTDLTVVSYGGADVGLLCAAEKVRKVVFGFVSLDSIPLDPHFRAARQAGRIEVNEYDEGMLQWGLYAAGIRMPYLPTRAGLGSDVLRVNPELQTIVDPYAGRNIGCDAGAPPRCSAGTYEPRGHARQCPIPRAGPVLRRPVLSSCRIGLCLLRTSGSHCGVDRGCTSVDDSNSPVACIGRRSRSRWCAFHILRTRLRP